MDYPVYETLFGIFAFGLVITGVVVNGIVRAKESAKRADAVQRAHGDRQSRKSTVPARRTAAWTEKSVGGIR